MFRKNKTTAKAASGNDLNTLLDVFDKIISGEISHTGESPANTNLSKISLMKFKDFKRSK